MNLISHVKFFMIMACSSIHKEVIPRVSCQLGNPVLAQNLNLVSFGCGLSMIPEV
jgi:hypothetical protein